MTFHEIVKPARRHCPGRRKRREAGTEQVFVQKEADPGKEKGGPGLSEWDLSSGTGTIGQDLEDVQRVSKLGKCGPGIPGGRCMMSKVHGFAGSWLIELPGRLGVRVRKERQVYFLGLFACKCWKTTSKKRGGHVWCASPASTPLSAVIAQFVCGRRRLEVPTLLYTHSLWSGWSNSRFWIWAHVSWLNVVPSCYGLNPSAEVLAPRTSECNLTRK